MFTPADLEAWFVELSQLLLSSPLAGAGLVDQWSDGCPDLPPTLPDSPFPFQSPRLLSVALEDHWYQGRKPGVAL